MSNFKTHSVTGVVVGGLSVAINVAIYKKLSLYMGTETLINIVLYSLPVAFVFSILPDIDIKSTSSRLIYGAVLLCLLGLYYLEKYQFGCMLAFIALIPQLFKHRAFTHTMLFGAIAPIPAYFIFRYQQHTQYFLAYYISAALGFMSHYMLDNLYVSSRRK